MSLVHLHRRQLLSAALALPFGTSRAASPGADAESLLREGGVLVAFRHALAPGTYDPPQFELGDCSTQRNLSDEGRAQARRIGVWFKARSLAPRRVRSSPWCRCIDTAQLAFGSAAPWAALGSPANASAARNHAALQELKWALASAPPGAFDAWVTHMFVLSALVGVAASSGDGLVLRADARGEPQVLAGWRWFDGGVGAPGKIDCRAGVAMPAVWRAEWMCHRVGCGERGSLLVHSGFVQRRTSCFCGVAAGRHGVHLR